MAKRKRTLTHNEILIKQARENNDLIRVKPKNPRKKLKLILPMCPSVNHAYKFARGKRFMTKDALMFMQTTHAIVEREKVKQKYSMEFKGVWLILEIRAYFPDRKVRDVHNMHKILADALNGSAYVDDQFLLIRDMGVYLDKENPRLEVVIYPQKYEVTNG